MRVLLSESASLTARETLTVLGRAGVTADLLHAGGLTIGRFSRYRRRLVRAPASALDPVGYLERMSELLGSGRYAAVLPTHEQAWLLAAGRRLLPPDAPVALASFAAFERVQGKLAFARLLDELDVPQPRWWPAGERPDDAPFPHWVKSSFGTAGRSVVRVTDAAEETAAVSRLTVAGDAVMGQAPAPGTYAQVQALFDHGRPVALHTSVLTGAGVGGSAAARCSVDHPAARLHAEQIGARLAWHGGLTLDYFHVDGQPQFIECNPRTVEPGNAAAAGVDLPRLSIALARAESLPEQTVVGRPGVRTRSLLALALGAAERTGSRRAVAGTVADAAVRRGRFGHDAEVLTPVLADPPSLVPLLVAVGGLLADPARAGALATRSVGRYAVGPDAIARVRARLDGLPPQLSWSPG